ncbi:universal stress protein [Natronomonas sp. LN261]|jgi:nucleotide-binding universal stress UspA family protein|uniref:universal stress protein n=1 Tax=Natronomonas sp. LN261 TaxID=2750669 RepID=UPI0015EFAFE3|nr:universal stress protein [Natronomonas sp. LN261]
MFERILIPIDGSDQSRAAAEKGVELAAEHDASVHILYVVEPVPLGRFSAGPEPASAGHGEILEEQKEEARESIDAIAELCGEHGLDVVDTIEYGLPVEEILEYVEAEGIDGIAMGTHGRSGAERVVIGSVAEKVVRKSPVPVVTIRAAA